MKIQFNHEKLRQNFSRKLQAYEKAKNLSQRALARYTLLQAKLGAARHTGETMRGITIEPTKKGWKCISTVSGNFKQNLFQNMTPPFDTLNFGVKGGANPNTGDRYYASNQSVRYGEPALSWSGNYIKWTGKPRFFDVAVLMARKRAKKQTSKIVSHALKKGLVAYTY
jgi:hypothetical protein